MAHHRRGPDCFHEKQCRPGLPRFRYQNQGFRVSFFRMSAWIKNKQARWIETRNMERSAMKKIMGHVTGKLSLSILTAIILLVGVLAGFCKITKSARKGAKNGSPQDLPAAPKRPGKKAPVFWAHPRQ